jgi:hypothetical protein
MQGWIWPRLGAICGLLYVVLVFGFTSTGSASQVMLLLELIGMLFFIPFLGYLYGILHRAEGEGGWLSATAFGAGLVEFTVKLVSVLPAFAARQERLSPQLERALENMGNFAYIVTMLPIGVMTSAVAIVVLKTRVLPLWLGLLAAITAPACLVNGMFLGADFGPAFLLFLLWVAIASVVLTLRVGVRRPVETSGPEPARVR